MIRFHAPVLSATLSVAAVAGVVTLEIQEHV